MLPASLARPTSSCITRRTPRPDHGAGQSHTVPGRGILGSVEIFNTRGTNPFAALRPDRKDDSLDTVTGLAPRRFGELQLKGLTQAVAEQTTTLGVLYLDADHFKDVNDTFGHKTGREVLRMVGTVNSQRAATR